MTSRGVPPSAYLLYTPVLGALAASRALQAVQVGGYTPFFLACNIHHGSCFMDSARVNKF